MTMSRDELTARFPRAADDMDEWLERAARDAQQVGWLPYEAELRQRYGWADADEFIKALLAAVRVSPQRSE